MYNTGKYKQHVWFVGFLRRFQGLGFVITPDNPITTHEYLLIELRLLWFKAWYIYKFDYKTNP